MNLNWHCYLSRMVFRVVLSELRWNVEFALAQHAVRLDPVEIVPAVLLVVGAIPLAHSAIAVHAVSDDFYSLRRH